MSNPTENLLPKEETETKAFCESYSRFVEWMRSRIFAETNVDHLLAMGRLYGEVRSANFDGVYQDNEIEDAIESRVRESGKLQVPDMRKSNGDSILVATSLSDVGGHSRVVLNWIKAFEDDDRHRLLVTRSMTDVFRASLERKKIDYRLCANRGINLVNEILVYCANAERIILHIHPDDIVSAVAAKILAEAGKKVIFYNHADHLFSYGICAAYIVGEISEYGKQLNKRVRPIRESCFLGIPIDFLAPSKNATDEPIGANKTIISCGAPYKYAPSSIFFGDFIDKVLLQRDNFTVVLVGPRGNEPWWARARQRWGDRIQFMGDVSHGEYLELMRSSEVYVDSFPITGGTAFPEALLSGKSVAGLEGPIQGYSPVDVIRAKNICALSELVIKLLDRDPFCVADLDLLRNKTMQFHSLTEFKRRVEAMYSGKCNKNISPHVSVDTHWLERRWASNRSISLTDSDVWFAMPLAFCISFQLTFSRVLGNSGKQHRGYMLRRTCLKLLPVNLRKQAIEARDRSIKHPS